MKKSVIVLLALVTGLGLFTAAAQPHGGNAAGPQFDGVMIKIFGENSAFSSAIEVQSTSSTNGNSVMVPGKLAYLDGKSRFEMDMTEMKGAGMSPQVIPQLKKMGMDKIVMIARPDKKISYLIYPNMSGYIEMPAQGAAATTSADDYKSEVTKISDEKVDGHACVKNKVVITGKDGKPHPCTVWNASDMKNFPVKIETSEKSADVVMSFKDVNLTKPAAADFEPPANYKKYKDYMEIMMSRMQH